MSVLGHKQSVLCQRYVVFETFFNVEIVLLFSNTAVNVHPVCIGYCFFADGTPCGVAGDGERRFFAYN